jgi:hypothetical protein
VSAPFIQPLAGNEIALFDTPGTVMRRPAQATAEGFDACCVGVPLDIGILNRRGAGANPRPNGTFRPAMCRPGRRRSTASRSLTFGESW